MAKAADIFISYSREDAPWLTRVVEHLRVLQTQGGLTLFTDRDFSYGEAWRQRIAGELAGMRVFVLLVSRHSLGSDFITTHEIPAARRRQEKEGILFLPLLVSDVSWVAVDWLKEMVLVRTEGEEYEPTPLAALPAEKVDAVLAEMTAKLGRKLRAQAGANADREFLVKLCDRAPQYRAFEKTTTALFKNEKTRVQLWIVYGEQRQALVSFTDRLFEQSLKPLPRVANDRERSARLHEVNDWPEPGEPVPGERLISALLEKVRQRASVELPSGGEFCAAAAAAFGTLWQEMAETMSLACFRHEVADAASPEALSALLAEYVGFLRAVVEGEAASAAHLPPLLFFICVPLPWVGLLPFSPWSSSAVACEVARLKALAGEAIEIAAVPELDSVRPEHVRDWFRENRTPLQLPGEHVWDRACSELFSAWRRKRPMRDVEAFLAEFLETAAPRSNP